MNEFMLSSLLRLGAHSNRQKLFFLKWLQKKGNREQELIAAVIIQYLRFTHNKIAGDCGWIDRYIDYDFFYMFRMCRETFQELFSEIDCPEFHANFVGGVEQAPGEVQLLATLWWLGKGEVLASVGDRFNLSVSSIFRYSDFILSKLLSLQNKYISWPDANELQSIEEDFREVSNYPGVIGAIDVSNIPFKCPMEQQDSYIDRKATHSIKLQAVCTAQRMFTNINVGFPGSVHDSRVFHNSSLFINITERNEMLRYIPLQQYHILGDSAYPLKTWLMTPYGDHGNLNQLQLRHNAHLSSTRIKIEHTFGMLKGRWTILKYINVNSVEKAVKIIAACCVRHNFCYVQKDVWDDYELEREEDIPYNNIFNDIQAEDKRYQISLHL